MDHDVRVWHETVGRSWVAGKGQGDTVEVEEHR